METPGPSFTKLFRGTNFVNAIKRHSAANFKRQVHVVNGFVKLVPDLMDGWLTCTFSSLFNSISVISEGKLGDYERLCVLKLRLWLGRLPP